MQGEGIEFEVSGFPPAKNEALSMLGERHAHAPRVVALLEAARAVLDDGFVPFAGPIGLEVELRASEGVDAWDATNYLGGIADVLEDKGRRGALVHLGELANVSVYRNDRQIKDVRYRQIVSEEPGYQVRIWPLDGPVQILAPRDELDLLLRVLQEQREAMVRKLDNLSEDQARWAPTGSGNSLLGLIHHLTHVERRWMDGWFLGGDVSREDSEFQAPAARTIQEVIADYRSAWARSDHVARSATALTEQAHHVRAFSDRTLRWILLHLVEETARHAGHADITRELIDGTTE